MIYIINNQIFMSYLYLYFFVIPSSRDHNSRQFFLLKHTLISWPVEIRTIKLARTFLFLTCLCFIVMRMKVLFFPSMTIRTSCLKNTTFLILTNECSSLPILTKLLRIIIKDMGFSSKILPIVSINTQSFVMFFIRWTPFSFKIKHIEVCIFLH